MAAPCPRPTPPARHLGVGAGACFWPGAVPRAPFFEAPHPGEKVAHSTASAQGLRRLAPAHSPECDALSQPRLVLPEREAACPPTDCPPESCHRPQPAGARLGPQLRLGESTDCGHTDSFWRNST